MGGKIIVGAELLKKIISTNNLFCVSLLFFFNSDTLDSLHSHKENLLLLGSTPHKAAKTDFGHWELNTIRSPRNSYVKLKGGLSPLPPSVFVLGSGPPWKNLFRGKSWNQLGTILIDRTPSIRSYLMYDATSCILLLQLIKKKLWERKRKLQ